MKYEFSKLLKAISKLTADKSMINATTEDICKRIIILFELRLDSKRFRPKSIAMYSDVIGQIQWSVHMDI